MSKWLEGCLEREPKTEWGESWKLDPAEEITKPCHDCGFCPYGQLVEAFPLHEEESKKALELGYVIEGGHPDLNRYIREFGPSEISCTVFGHDCPVFYCAEPLAE